MSEDTTEDVAKRIEYLAVDAFKDHVLRPTDRLGTYACRNITKGFHWFFVRCEPCFIFFWGDCGDFVLRVSDSDSKAWLLGRTERDYALGKVTALEGAKTEFRIGDANKYLDDMIETASKDHIDDDPMAGLTDDAKEIIREVEEVREALRDVEYDSPQFHEQAWHEKWSELGDSDPASCKGWTSSMFWLWEMIKTFVRLYPAMEAKRLAAGTP